MQEKKMPLGRAIGESTFDIAYLCFDIVAGIWFLAHAAGRSGVLWWGIMALVLGIGDAFHLVPRIASAFCPSAAWMRLRGIGKCITSITMTLFYMILFWNARNIFGVTPPMTLTVAVCLLAIARIVLCLCPQNRWASGGNGRWGIWRNIPFALLGIVVMIQYAVLGAGTALRFAWLAVLLSFAFYIPVVLWADKKPALGALMLPKTCAYVWLICMGFALVG